jgi:membrane fusion protein, multidrug efflux system
VVLNEVSRIDTILVRFSITETQYLNLARYTQSEDGENMLEFSLDLILADGSTHGNKGRIDFGNRQIDPTTGTMLIQASFPNPNEVIRPGQFARVKALIGTLDNGIMIPQRCISEIQGIHQVWW